MGIKIEDEYTMEDVKKYYSTTEILQALDFDDIVRYLRLKKINSILDKNKTKGE